mmetsp:Transcript_130617/g.418819  ORF Transcript_130617/g.418819 Transcript_130617/m.418819 type:complete len:104 (+) Transcript_130617:77-388(+)
MRVFLERSQEHHVTSSGLLGVASHLPALPRPPPGAAHRPKNRSSGEPALSKATAAASNQAPELVLLVGSPLLEISSRATQGGDDDQDVWSKRSPSMSIQKYSF